MLGMSGANTFKGDERQYDFKNTILYMNLLPYSYLRAVSQREYGPGGSKTAITAGCSL